MDNETFESKMMSEFAEDEKKYYDKIQRRNERFLNAILRRISIYKFNQLKDFIFESGNVEITGIVRRHKVSGDKQSESPFWFKHIFITQRTGYVCDDYSGTIFIPITEKHFLKFEYSC